MPILFSDAPNSVKICVLNGKNTATKIKLVSSVTVIPLPIETGAFLVSLFP